MSVQQPASSPRSPRHLTQRPTRKIQLDDETEPILVYEDFSSANTGVGGEIWDASFLLARWLRCSGCQGKTVLELGAGTGIVGIYASQLGGNVVMTDTHSTLAVTKHNVDCNQAVVDKAAMRGGGSVSVQGLDWLEHGRKLPPVPKSTMALGCWDVVLGSDILYDGRCYEALASVIEEAARTGREVAQNQGRAKCMVVLAWSTSPNEKLLERFWDSMRKRGFNIEFATAESQADILGEYGEALYEKYADASDSEAVHLAVLMFK